MSVSYQWSRRKGTTAQHSTFVGVQGEITIDTDKNTVVVHDGVTPGGYPLAKMSDITVLTNAVKLTGDQTIAGVKTFSSTITGNITGNAGSATKLQTARTINGVAFDGTANITVSDSTAVKLTGDQTIAGVKTFSSSPIVPTPTGNTQAANKAYVDNALVNTSALPIGAILSGYTIFANCIVAFGGEFNRADYPKLWAYLQANPTLLKTQAQWTSEATANGGICGFFSGGNGTTTFRVPNLDKAFLRPDSRSIGSYQGDAIRNIIGALGVAVYYFSDIFGAFYRGPVGSVIRGYDIEDYNVYFDAARVVPTSNENRPKNIAVLPLIVAK